MQHYNERVAERIASRMKADGTTQAALCSAIGMHRTTLWRKLNGHRSFDADEIEAIAHVFGLEPEQLGGEAAA